ncbi:uncharacterized protein EI90DRAFT_3013150 [Cantharellus anzutake]|uniref:uncharacterized protein n=1 Tax=Cantharellus anzutake TaxID=1750568 RepID=UPI001904DEAB|nr:uncharacterized protein EI90DRAFT_3013150 [Cantharellus anzutake]KAF8339091.1 hypothetical protein EI90DRAFT_3013150 [Cantharellus anzutake]
MWDGIFVHREPRDLECLCSLAAAMSPRVIDLIVELSQKTSLIGGAPGGHLSVFMQPNAYRLRELKITRHSVDDWYFFRPDFTIGHECNMRLFFSIFKLSLPNLSSLHIDLGFTVRIPQTFGGPTCNSLRSIEMHHVSLEQLEFWRKGFLLERLTLGVDSLGAGYKSLHQILSLQSTLQELRLTLPGTLPEPHTHKGMEVLHFPKLKFFCFTAMSYTLLTTLSMPALQCLHLKPFELHELDPEDVQEVAALQKFLSLHSSTLKTLEYMPINPNYPCRVTRAGLQAVDSKVYSPVILPVLSKAVLLVYGQFSYSFHVMHCPNLEELNIKVVDEVPSFSLFDFVERSANALRSLHITRWGPGTDWRESPILSLPSKNLCRLLYLPQLQDFVSRSARGDEIFGFVGSAPHLRDVHLSGKTFEGPKYASDITHKLDFPSLETLTLAQFSQHICRLSAPSLTTFILFSLDVRLRRRQEDDDSWQSRNNDNDGKDALRRMSAGVIKFMADHADTIETLTLLDCVEFESLQSHAPSGIQFPRLAHASMCLDDPILEWSSAPNVRTLELFPALYSFDYLSLDGWKSAEVLILGKVIEPFPHLVGFDSLLQLRIHVDPSHERTRALEARFLTYLAEPLEDSTWLCPKLKIFEVFVIESAELMGLTWPGRLSEESDDDGSSYHPSMTSETDLYRTDWEDSDFDSHSEDLEQDSEGIIPLNEDEEAEYTPLSFASSTHRPDTPPRSWTAPVVLPWDLIRAIVEGRFSSPISKLVVKRGRFVTQDLALQTI